LNRDHSWVIADALRAYLEVYHLQVDHIRKALAGADRGEFATEEEVRPGTRENSETLAVTGVLPMQANSL
jgi:predicted transcriptional regulator